MTTLKQKHHDEADLYEDVEKIKAALRQASGHLKGRAAEIWSDSIDDVKEQANSVKDNVADYTTKKPFQSLGAALLVGIAVGYLLRK